MGTLTATATTCGVPVECRYYANAAEVPKEDEVAGWVDLTYFGFAHLALAKMLAIVVVWSGARNDRPAALQGLNPREAQYYPATRELHILADYARWELLAHEYGHHLQTVCGVLPDGSDFGKRMLSLYTKLRNPQPNAVERMAEDFKDFVTGTSQIAWLGDYFHACAAGRGV